MHSSVGMQLISIKAMLSFFFAGSRRCVANNSTSCTKTDASFPYAALGRINLQGFTSEFILHCREKNR